MELPGGFCGFGEKGEDFLENPVFDFFRFYERVVEIKNQRPDFDVNSISFLLPPNIPGCVPKG